MTFSVLMAAASLVASVVCLAAVWRCQRALGRAEAELADCFKCRPSSIDFDRVFRR